jgi:integral membrane protein (TIGR01906 family)
VTSVPAVASEVASGPDVLAWLRTLAAIAFVLAVPFLLIGANLRSLVSDRDFMLAGFRDNQVALTTGLDDRELARVADAFVQYFKVPPGRMDVQVTVGGQTRPLFNEREIEHMEDVQALIQLFFRLQVLAAVVMAARVVLALVVERSVVPLGRDMLLGAGLVVALVVLVGILAQIDFTELWIRFHEVAFRNDLWQLDPTSDYLIMLFPEPFWYACTIRMATGMALQTALLAAGGFLAWRFGPGPH